MCKIRALSETALTERNVMSAERKAVRLAGAELHRHCHACAFFNSQDEEYKLLVPFAKEGYDQGEHVFHIADPAQREERLQRLTDAGIDCDVAGRPGQIKVPVWQDVYLQSGRFDQDAILALLENVFTQAKADLNRFSAAVVMDVLRTHPLVIMGGLLHEKPFFVAPEAFLCELRQRRASTSPK